VTSQIDIKAPPEAHAALRDGKSSCGGIRAYCYNCDPERRHRDGGTLWAGLVRGKPWWGCHRCHVEEDYRAGRRSAYLQRESYTGKARDDKQRSAAAIEIFNRARPLCTDDAADLYLRIARRLVPSAGAWSTDLRLARLKYRVDDKTMTGPWPVMVAGIRNSAGMLVALHRTFLFESPEHGVIKLNDKRVPDQNRVRAAKLSLGPLGGCAIRLGIDSETIGICEGVESALGLAMATNYTCWAAISANNMKALQIPKFVQRVVIGPDIGDKRDTGLDAAIFLQNRLRIEARRARRPLEVEIMAPPLVKPGDWADWAKARK
jgi:hypothetical protein